MKPRKRPHRRHKKKQKLKKGSDQRCSTAWPLRNTNDQFFKLLRRTFQSFCDTLSLILFLPYRIYLGLLFILNSFSRACVLVCLQGWAAVLSTAHLLLVYPDPKRVAIEEKSSRSLSLQIKGIRRDIRTLKHQLKQLKTNTADLNNTQLLRAGQHLISVVMVIQKQL